MVDIKLEASSRSERGRHARNLLAQQGRIPGVVYGKEMGSMSIAVDLKDIQRIVKNFGTGKIIDLRLKDGKGDGMKVLLKDVQYDPVRKELTHVDLQSVKMTEKIKTNVKIKFVGKPIGAQQGGVLQRQLDALEIECLPADIPDQIVVDVSDLNVGQSIHVKDLSLPKGVKTTTDPEAVVASVTMMRTAEAEELTSKEPDEEIPAKEDSGVNSEPENAEAQA